MQHANTELDRNRSSSADGDFAGLLASLAASRPTELPPWRDDELLPDVATLSYEQALKNHARHRPSDPLAGEIFGTAADQAKPLGNESAGAAAEVDLQADSRRSQQADRVLSHLADERDRKCASVTVRMSQAECDQLRERAAEANMTISAYLRSCTFEAEALRAQVKEVLTELRRAQEAHHDPKQKWRTDRRPASGRWLAWLRKFIPDLRTSRNAVRA
jgi:hypothetical protein